MSRPGVLMVTGAYYPEMSGAGLQCRALVSSLRDRVDYLVLTTTTDASLPADDRQDGVSVRRIYVDPKSLVSKSAAAWRMLRAFASMSSRIGIVHLHGFSQKSLLIVLLARLTGKKIAIKLTSFGDDDPLSIAKRGRFTAWCFRKADAYIAVSPKFQALYAAAGLPPRRFHEIPNGVDVNRFRPASAAERQTLRRELGVPDGGPMILFVGFFSREKQPDVLFKAWAATVVDVPSVLVFIGSTRGGYHEIDPSLADGIRAEAATRGLHARLHFVEATHEIERFHRAADIFVLPSLREGMPNALVEAMASAAACIVTRLPGITDRLVDDGRTGLIVEPGDTAALARALDRLLRDPQRRLALGAAARRDVEMRFAMARTADAHLAVYRTLLGEPCAA